MQSENDMKDTSTRISYKTNIDLETLLLDILKETQNKPSKKDLVAAAVSHYRESGNWKTDFLDQENADYKGYTFDQITEIHDSDNFHTLDDDVQEWYLHEVGRRQDEEHQQENRKIEQPA